MNSNIKPSKLINNEAYYTFEQAVQLLPFSGRTLCREIARGKIRSLEMGTGKFFKPEWIEEYIEKHIKQPKAAPHLGKKEM